MPELGEIKRAKEIGRKDGKGSAKFIWYACEKCGKQRWVRLVREKPIYTLCFACAKGKHERTKRTDGYIYTWLKHDDFLYPMTLGGRILEHRLVMAKKLGRCLQPWEMVHHKNGKRDDNRPENLELVTYLENLSADLILANQKQLLQEIRILRLQVKELTKQLQGRLV